MEEVRYRPGEALRWLGLGAEGYREQAEKQGKSVWHRSGERSVGKDVKQVAGALADLGRSALAELKTRQAEASEYVLHDDFFEIVEGSKPKSYRYSEVIGIKYFDERATLVLEKGSLTIKPFAHIVAGQVKVPVGWSRNGMEVPYGLLIDELAARCGVRIDDGV
jgi:hypothetical protein